MSHNWLQGLRKQLGIPGLHISSDVADSCQHKVRCMSSNRYVWCLYCSPSYRGRHRR